MNEIIEAADAVIDVFYGDWTNDLFDQIYGPVSDLRQAVIKFKRAGRTDANWQPIETAPKGVDLLFFDGAHVFSSKLIMTVRQNLKVTHDPCGTPIFTEFDTHVTDCDNLGDVFWRGDVFRRPTHWMPIPCSQHTKQPDDSLLSKAENILYSEIDANDKVSRLAKIVADERVANLAGRSP